MMALWFVTMGLVLPAAANDLDPSWVVAQLKQPVPSQTSFLEVRDSPMLKAPLQVSGLFRRPDATTLVREVQQPYQETSIISHGTVRVQRQGRRERLFQLDRAPELATLQDSFSALMGGRLEQLQKDFALRSNGTRQRWSLILTPRSADVGRRLRQLVLHGRNGELGCIQAVPVRGTPQQTLVGSLADTALRERVTDPVRLKTLCEEGVS